MWSIDREKNHVFVENGALLKKEAPIFLPDGTWMEPKRMFRVKNLCIDGEVSVCINKENKIYSLSEFKFVGALRGIDSRILLILLPTETNPPIVFNFDAKLGQDFQWLEISEIPTQDLKIKLQRNEEIENYEYCAIIHDELISREKQQVSSNIK